MMKWMFWCLIPLLTWSCIGDDIIFDTVDASVRIINPIDTLAVGSEYAFEAIYTNNVGQEEDVPLDWISTDPTRLNITAEGLASGISQGTVSIIARAPSLDPPVSDTLDLIVGETTSNAAAMTRRGTIRTTSSYQLEGNFTLGFEGDDLVLAFDSTYISSDRLPGLYIYLTNNPNTTNGAYEIGEVEVFEGAHSYLISDEVELNQYEYVLYFCKPFNVKVGDGKIE